MTESLSSPTLSNKRNRQRSLEPQVSSHHEFLDVLYDDLEFVIDRLSMHRDKYAAGMRTNPKEGEDLINTTIADMLCARGWSASHDTHINGHADISVTIPYTDYLWIGESKINQGSSYIHKGFKQLLYRYSTGLDNKSAGGIIVYMAQTNKTQTEIMKDWQEMLSGKEVAHEVGIPLLTKDKCNLLGDDQYVLPPTNYFTPCPKNTLCFYSTHTHPQSGKDYVVRHMAIDFRHTPQDQNLPKVVKPPKTKEPKAKKAPTKVSKSTVSK